MLMLDWQIYDSSLVLDTSNVDNIGPVLILITKTM